MQSRIDYILEAYSLEYTWQVFNAPNPLKEVCITMIIL